MFAAKRLFTVIIVCAILLGQNLVNGFKVSCPKPAVVDLTKETPDSSGAVNKSGVFFPLEAIQYDDDDKKFGCMCDIRKCIPFCCPFGYAASSNGCVEDEYKTIAWEVNAVSKSDKFHVFVHDPCQLSTVENTFMKRYNSVRDVPADTLFREHCLLREVNTTEYLVALCRDGRSILGVLHSTGIEAWRFTCETVRVLFLLVTLVVYSVTPELKNLQGLLLRCYIGSELTAHTLFYVSYIWNTGSTLVYTILLWITASAQYYFNSATVFWLTVISFDVWWKFRRIQSNRPNNAKEYAKARFLRYSICAWCGSIIVPSIELGCLIWLDVADPLTKSTYASIRLTLLCPVASTYIVGAIFSICTFASTALTIRRQKKEIARAVNGVDKNRKDNTDKQRTNLYLALFTLMGCYKVFQIANMFWGHPIYIKFSLTLGMLHGILTFLIFVWKDDVKRSFRSQITIMFRKWVACRQPHTTPVTKNDNENL